MPAPMHNRHYYDQFSARYERGRGQGYHALIDALEIEVVLRYGKGGTILEAGCGTGLILKELAAEAKHAVGVDLSSGMLAHAARRGLQVAQGSITDLPFPDDRFDVVCSFKVLAHVEKIREAIAEMSRVTKPGGHLVLEFYNPYSLRGLVKRLKPPTHVADNGTHDEHVYTRYDTLPAIKRILPPDHVVEDLRGVRVVTPAAAVFSFAPAARVFDYLERKACDAPVLRRLGGFLIVVVRKPA